MISKKTIAAAVVALGALVAVPAHAGGVSIDFNIAGHGWNHHHGGYYYERPRRHWQDYRLSAREVRRILRHRGYRNINFIDRSGPTYEVGARRNGKRFYLVVNARSGNIIVRSRF